MALYKIRYQDRWFPDLFHERHGALGRGGAQPGARVDRAAGREESERIGWRVYGARRDGTRGRDADQDGAEL